MQTEVPYNPAKVGFALVTIFLNLSNHSGSDGQDQIMIEFCSINSLLMTADPIIRSPLPLFRVHGN